MKIDKRYYNELVEELKIRKEIRAQSVKAEADAWRETMHDADDESRRYRKEAEDQ